MLPVWCRLWGLFLSTPSARRATYQTADSVNWSWISIHALREEGDQCNIDIGNERSYFYPRPPRGGRLFIVQGRKLCQLISIHALREEGDKQTLCRTSSMRNFYPRPPRGGRQCNLQKYQ